MFDSSILLSTTSSHIDEYNPSIWTPARVPTNTITGNLEVWRRLGMFREAERIEGMKYSEFGRQRC